VSLSAEAAGGEWTSSDASVATVDNNGNVSAISAGSVDIIHSVTNSSGEVSSMATRVQVNASALQAQLVPNPNEGVFTINGTTGADEDEPVAIEITGLAGQVIYQGSTMAIAGVINVPLALRSDLANGMYILSIKSGGGRKVFHFVVER
jgi:hypothetical protein